MRKTAFIGILLLIFAIPVFHVLGQNDNFELLFKETKNVILHTGEENCYKRFEDLNKIWNNGQLSSAKKTALLKKEFAKEIEELNKIKKMSAAELYEKARGTNDPENMYLQRAAELGHSDAQRVVGAIWINGSLSFRSNPDHDSFQKGVIWLKRAGNSGNIEALLTLADVFWKLDFYADSIEYYKKAAELGNARAMVDLGNISCVVNAQQSIRWYEAAISAAAPETELPSYIGNKCYLIPRTYLKIASFYSNGMKGLSPDFEMAEQYLKKALDFFKKYPKLLNSRDSRRVSPSINDINYELDELKKLKARKK